MWKLLLAVNFVLISLLFSWPTEAAPLLNDISKDNESYTAHLTLPEGSGPFPVVVLSHGRGGAKGSYYNWGRQMTEWGFAAIAMDHYTPRGHGKRLPHGIMGTSDSFDARRHDLISVLKVIKEDKRLNNARVTLAGWSRGAGFVGHGIFSQSTREAAEFEHPIRTAVLFYPQTNTFHKNFVGRFNLPVILLTGDEDYIWISPPPYGWRSELTKYKHQDHPLILKLYEGATHLFDNPHFQKKRCRQLNWGPHCRLYDEDAHKQSINDLKVFLERYSK